MSQNDNDNAQLENAQLEIALEQLKQELENTLAENELGPQQVSELRDIYVGRALNLHASAPKDTDFGPFNDFLLWSERFAHPEPVSQDGELVGGWFVNSKSPSASQEAPKPGPKSPDTDAELAFAMQLSINRSLRLKFKIERLIQIHNNLETIKESYEEAQTLTQSDSDDETALTDDNLSSTVDQEDVEVENLISLVGEIKHELDGYFKRRIEKYVSLNNAFRTVCLYGTWLHIVNGKCAVRTVNGYEWRDVEEAMAQNKMKAWWYNPFS